MYELVKFVKNKRKCGNNDQNSTREARDCFFELSKPKTSTDDDIAFGTDALFHIRAFEHSNKISDAKKA